MLTAREQHHPIGANRAASAYYYQPLPASACCVNSQQASPHSHHYENLICDPLSGFHPSSCSSSFYQASSGTARPYFAGLLPTSTELPASTTAEHSPPLPHFQRLHSVSTSSSSDLASPDVARKMTDLNATDSACAVIDGQPNQCPSNDSPVNADGSSACCSVPWALVSKRDNSQLNIEARNGFVNFIGVDIASCELVLGAEHTDSTVDGRQAVLVYASGSFHLKDLNSSYGTYINERRVPSRCFVQLNEHDEVRFGFSANVYLLLKLPSPFSSSSRSSCSAPSSPGITPASPQSSTNSLQIIADDNELSSSLQAISKTTGPMNKLLRLKKGSRRKSTKDHPKDVPMVNGTAGATSKLSPSSSSLMSSASSNSSSSSSSATSPSSVFMSAMKMMKMRFKKKSSKDKSMVCSANDDITFIRYDSHNDMTNGAQSMQSASAPESPSQPHSRIFRSNTCLDSCSDRDNSPTLDGQNNHSGDLACLSNKSKSNFVLATATLPEVEHDYDEVAREDDTTSTEAAERLLDLDQCLSAEVSQCELIEENEAGSTLDSVIDDLVNEDDDTFNDLLEENGEDDEDIVYGGHVDAYAEFENCLLGDHYAASHHVKASADLESFDPDHAVIGNGEKQTISNCSSMIVLPHLNSDDRLNNNSSLDTLLTDSILAKNLSHCETVVAVDNSGSGSCKLTNSPVMDNGTKSDASLASSTQHPHSKDNSRPQLAQLDHSLTSTTGQEHDIVNDQLIHEPSCTVGESTICLDQDTARLDSDSRFATSFNADEHSVWNYHQQRSSTNNSVSRRATVAKNNNNGATSQQRFSLRSNSRCSSNNRSCSSGNGSGSICPNSDGNYHHNRTLFDNQAKQLEQQESCYQSALSSVETALSEQLPPGQFTATSCANANLSVAATGDPQNRNITAANDDSSRESLDAALSECKYDIDDIGHLRRNLKPTAPSVGSDSTAVVVGASADIEMSSHSLNVHDNNNRPACAGQPQLSLKDTQNESRQSHGGVAFVISLDGDCEAGLSKALNDKLFVSSRRESHKARRSSANLSEPPCLHSKSARPRNVIAKSTATMTTAAPVLLSSAGSRKNGSQCEVMLLPEEDEEEVHTLKAASKNRDILDDTNKRKLNQDSQLNTQKVPEEYNAYGFSAKHQSQQSTNSVNINNNNNNSNFCNDTNWNNSDPTMKKIKNSVDTSDASSKASSSSSIRRSNRAAQLSESAVYLINRMFEDSDYHRYHDNVDATDPYGSNYPEASCYPDTSPRLADQQSISSSRSASPYSMRDNRQYHNSLANYICNSSDASARMEYDESLSSHHTNFNSGQRLSRLASLSTVVQSNSNHDKQADSAIDDEDLIPDDLSDTGTYTVEIDDCGEHKIKKNSMSNSDNDINGCVDSTSLNKQTKWPQNDKNVTTGEQSTDDDIPAVATDYEADADYELEDEDDKLEIARRKIDELFNVYSNKNDKPSDTSSNNGSHNTNSTVNNSTFTRSKRRSSQQTEPQTEEDEEAAAGSATSDEYFSTVSKQVETSKPAKSSAKSSKSQISNELMNALKKINSKLDKTAKLGSDSLNSKKKSKSDKMESTPTSKLRPMTSYTPSNQKSLNSQSAPSTPVLSGLQNRKNYRPKLQPKVSQPLSNMSSRKNSITNSASSIDDRYTSADDFDDHSSAVSTETYARPRSESVNSTASTQSGLMRFNRAFALRRARLGMDTCGVEISDQAASKAKDSHVKPVPKQCKQLQNNSFKRNDGGRFSLRVPNATPSSPSPVRRSAAVNKQPTVRKPLSTPKAPVTSVTKQIMSKPKLPSLKAPSVENLPTSKVSSPRAQRKQRILSTTTPIVTPVAPVRKNAHSDNEIVHDSESSCDETPLFSRFGRSSLRTPVSANSSTPWLQSLKANSPIKQRIPTTTAASSLYSSMQKSSSFSANAGKNYSQRGSHIYISETYDSLSSTTTAPTECVRSIPSFQMGKRFFSTKPHQMAQFDRDFSSVARSSSAATGANGNKLPPDPNLMTHSATESLLSRHGVSASSVINPDMSGGHRVETSPQISSTTAQSITSNINARIFSISPLDSLVISAINQLSSKLRTRMRDVLEQERSNHLIGSETRSLIDEILPQVSTVTGLDSRSGQSKNAFPHEASNISRDLSNILKNLKKVEQIFDVFYMLLEPNDASLSNCQEVSSDQAIVTHASDSDNSDSQQVVMKHPYLSSAMANCSKPAGPMSHHHRSQSGPSMSRFSSRQPAPPPPSQSPPSDSTPSPLHLTRNGFFIEL